MICTINFNDVNINYKVMIFSHYDALVIVAQKYGFGA
jgi:hypothetical protein